MTLPNPVCPQDKHCESSYSVQECQLMLFVGIIQGHCAEVDVFLGKAFTVVISWKCESSWESKYPSTASIFQNQADVFQLKLRGPLCHSLGTQTLVSNGCVALPLLLLWPLGQNHPVVSPCIWNKL